MYRKKSIHLVTGASGFIGRRLAARLAHDGHSVCALGRRQIVGSWDTFMQADIAKDEPLPSFSNIETVYHLASKAHAVSEKPGDESGYYEVIVEGTKRVIESAERAGVARFIYISSVKAAGEGGFSREMLSEDDQTSPESPYGKCKREAEDIVLNSKIPHVVVLRPAMVYGFEHKGNLARMADAILKNRFPPIKENGNRRSIVHVEDLIDACLAATHCPNANREIIIVAGSQAYSTRELYDCLRAELNLKPVTWYLPNLALYAAAMLGDLAGKLLRKRMPLDSDTLLKLMGSAYYDNTKSRKILNLTYDNAKRPFLELE